MIVRSRERAIGIELAGNLEHLKIDGGRQEKGCAQYFSRSEHKAQHAHEPDRHWNCDQATDAALTRIATAESAAYMSADPATADPV
jgi:hypothetical protein